VQDDIASEHIDLYPVYRLPPEIVGVKDLQWAVHENVRRLTLETSAEVQNSHERAICKMMRYVNYPCKSITIGGGRSSPVSPSR
jgi:hypothetical protein